jgi:amidase
MTDNIALAPAREQLALLEKGEISSAELVETYLERIETHNPGLNAIVTLDADGARRQARAADAARAGGQSLGPLHGLPITLKDSFETAGMRSVCGRMDLRDNVPETDAEAVIRLRKAGAIIMGKTNMPPGNQDVQADNHVFGPTNNVWDHSRTSGGSAGGGAVAAAAGLCSLDFGSEIGGSTRIPAQYNGLYGHKATWRSIPLIGHLSPGPGTARWSEPDMACAGMQARDAWDIVPVLNATVGALDRDGGFSYRLSKPRARKLRDFRVAVWANDPACPVDADVSAALERALEVLQTAGAKVDANPKALPVTLGESHSVFEPLVYGQFSVDRSGFTPAFVATMAGRLARSPRGDASKALRGTLQSHSAWIGHDAKRQEMREKWTAFFRDYDIVLMPVTPTTAPPHHHKIDDKFGRPFYVDGVARSYWDQVKWNAVANIAGSPATTMPAGFGRNGLPIGLQAMGPAAGDLTTIEFAGLLGRELGGYQVPPAYV